MSGKANAAVKKNNIVQRMRKDYAINRLLYAMLIPVITYYVLFHYIPMLGSVIAFKNFSPRKGIWESNWVGLKYFEQFFGSFYFARVMRNTLVISFMDILFGFPLPILMAICLNEIRCKTYKGCMQTISYLPYFISTVVVCGMIHDMFAIDGVVNVVLEQIGLEKQQFMTMPEAFKPIFIGSNIWQTAGYNSIVYLAALTAINQDLYEAAVMDGAGKLRQIWHITLPGIRATIVTLLILRLGAVMNVGFEKVILLYNDLTMETADVISTFVYRKGLLDMNYSYSTAVGLFNSLISCLLLVAANACSRKLNDASIW